MSSNVEIVRESLRCFAAGDFEALAGTYHEDAFAVAPPGWPESGRFEGRDAVMAQFERLQGGWKEQRFVEQAMASAGDWVTTRIIWHVRGSRSGYDGQIDVSMALRLCDGKIAEVHYFWDYGEALEAAGLSSNPSTG